MLSQRVILLTLEYKLRKSVEVKKQALDSLTILKKNHIFLLSNHALAISKGLPSPLSEALYNLYFSEPHSINEKVPKFVSLVGDDWESNDAKDNVSNIKLEMASFFFAKNELLIVFDTAVTQYEYESTTEIKNLLAVQKAILLLIVLVVLMEGVFIIKPLLAKSEKFAEVLQKEANVDYLTWLLNRRSFEILSTQAIDLSQRYESELSILYIDIENFKSYNDKYGHKKGDSVIQLVSAVVKKNTRHSDSVFRFGGEEFAVLLPKTSDQEAVQLAEKISMKVSETTSDRQKFDECITISCGVSSYIHQEKGPEAVLKRADDALYQAKNSGRNKVILFSS
ncbi:MAG: diguanylate cyclase (GGDEF)-like protein [Glaciecola sp.]|jgi:diguanylate cyclase (GGDEF)-like protein